MTPANLSRIDSQSNPGATGSRTPAGNRQQTQHQAAVAVLVNIAVHRGALVVCSGATMPTFRGQVGRPATCTAEGTMQNTVTTHKVKAFRWKWLSTTASTWPDGAIAHHLVSRATVNMQERSHISVGLTMKSCLHLSSL